MTGYTKIPPEMFKCCDIRAENPECFYCEHKMVVEIVAGEFVQLCKNHIHCTDFTPKKVE